LWNHFNKHLPAAKITGADTSSLPPSDDVAVSSDDSTEELDEAELGDFLMDALSEYEDPQLDPLEAF